MTLDEFRTIGCGTILRWENPTGPRLRTVIIGPRDHVEPWNCNGIFMPILHRSWTRRPYTVFVWNDTKLKEAKIHRLNTQQIASKFELSALLNWCIPSQKIEEMIREKQSYGVVRNPLRDPISLCKRIRELRNTLRWASI